MQKLLVLQQPGVEQLVRNMVAQPVQRMVQQMSQVVSQAQVPADKREAMGKQVDALIKKYEDETTPLVRAEALKLAPTNATAFEEKFNEEELKVLVAWFESPVNKKFQQVFPEIQNAFVQKLVTQSGPAVEPKLSELGKGMQVLIDPYMPAARAAAGGAAASAPAKPKAKAKTEGK